MDLPEFKRYETVQGVEYEVLSSNKRTYYTVQLINGKGAGCECRHARFNPACKHQEQAEREERLYRDALRAQKPREPEWHVKAPLNGQGAFSILR